MPEYYRAAVASGDPDYIGALAQFDNAVGRVRQVRAKRYCRALQQYACTDPVSTR